MWARSAKRSRAMDQVQRPVEPMRGNCSVLASRQKERRPDESIATNGSAGPSVSPGPASDIRKRSDQRSAGGGMRP